MISRADKIDGSGKVKGYLINVCTIESVLVHDKTDFHAKPTMLQSRINPSTLEHSFDNGENWYKEEHIALMIRQIQLFEILKEK